VSDLANKALITDPNLQNPWGIAINPTGDFWISNNATNGGAGSSTLYGGDVNGSPFFRDSLVVQMPFPNPTGVVVNTTGSFKLADGNPALFLFAEETPWAIGWDPGLRPPTQAQFVVDTVGTGAVYKGLVLGSSGGANFMYLANFNAGTVEVYDTNFHRTTLAGNFTDPNPVAGFAPFNIANIGGQLYVTYAKQLLPDKHDDQAGPGNGFIDVFNPDGTFVKRLVTGSGAGGLAASTQLNSPWGLAVAPAGFGTLGGDLLVGNFGDGHINAYNPTTGAFVGSLNDAAGNPIAINGLWGLQFGNGTTAGDSGTLYFTAGLNGETDGVFGSLKPNGTNPLSGTATTVSGTAGMPLPGVLATFADTTAGKTANDFTVTITVNGQSSPGTVTAGRSGFLVTGPATNPTGGTSPVTILIQEKGTGGASLTLTGMATVTGTTTPPPSGGSGTTPPPGGSTPGTPAGTPGQRFVTQVVQDLFGQAPSARTLKRFASRLDRGASARAVAVGLLESFGGRVHRAVHQLAGSGSSTQRAQQLVQNLLGRPANPAADGALLSAVARKLAHKGNDVQTLALVLSSPEFLALVGM
jgi:uncharacterized protein (TIGR03118 family)